MRTGLVAALVAIAVAIVGCTVGPNYVASCSRYAEGVADRLSARLPRSPTRSGGNSSATRC